MSRVSDILKKKIDPECSEIQVVHDHQIQKTIENLNPLLLQTVHCAINNNDWIWYRHSNF